MTINELVNRLNELPQYINLYFHDCFGQMFTTNFICNNRAGKDGEPTVIVKPIKYIKDGIKVSKAIRNLKQCNGKELLNYKKEKFILNSNDTLFLVINNRTMGTFVSIKEITNFGYCKLKLNSY